MSATSASAPAPPKKMATAPYVQSQAKKKAAAAAEKIISIDEKHTTMMNEFEKLETEEIPKLERELEELKTRLKELTETNKMDEFMETRDRIATLRAEIRTQKRRKKTYLLENTAFLFNYFEEKKNISSGKPPDEAATTHHHHKKTGENKKKINAFFKIKTAKIDPQNSEPRTETIESDKYRNARKYWANVNHNVISLSDYTHATDNCHICGEGELISQEDEGILICNNPRCGVFLQHIIDCEKPSYKEPPSEVSYTAYLRLNHFKEILSQFQAKETTQIPDEVIEAIRQRIKKERITDLSEITYAKTRDILRKLGYNKYFEHIQYINCKFGITPPTMSEELIETLCVLFIEIQAPWAMHCPSTRTNFFNYAYTLYQLCKLLGQTEFLPYIPLLKDFEKQREQDMIWKKVCEELDWYFYPTI